VNNLRAKLLFGLAAVAIMVGMLLSRVSPESAQPQARGVEYTFASGFGPVLESQLSDAAAKGWRAKGIALGQNNVIVVLMERSR
jgi:hypothetical protein